MRSISALPDVRLVYKPHPKVTTSTNAAIRDGHDAILARLAHANREPDAGHSASAGDILAVMPECDVIVTDVSSVGLDWLYLHTEKPIVLTDRHHDPERLRQDVPVSRCADVIDDTNVAELTELLTSTPRRTMSITWPGSRCVATTSTTSRSATAQRASSAVSELVTLRDRLIGAGLPPEDVRETATA